MKKPRASSRSLHSQDSLQRQTDAALMESVRCGEQAAFVCLVRRYQNHLVNFFRRLGVCNDAEDLAQETFLRLYRYRKRYRPCAPFKRFLFRMAHHAHVDYLRKQARRIRPCELPEDLQAPDPSSGEAAEEIDRALESLSPLLRRVVVLKVYGGLSYAEIACTLKIPLGTVKSRMFHALSRLREYFQEEGVREKDPFQAADS